VTPRLASAPVLCGFALLAGLLQIVASIQLGMARLAALQTAAVEGSMPYVLGTLAAVVGVAVVWSLRRRLLLAAGVFVLWQGAILVPLRAKTTSLGLSYHGEYILHHFSALVAAAAVGVVAWSWAQRRELGTARLAPVVLAVGAATALLTVHVWREPGVVGEPPEWLHSTGTALALAAWATAIPTLWRRLGPTRIRVVSVALLLPFVLRIVWSWPEGLVGASVFDAGRPWVMTLMVTAALVTFVGFRPRMPPTYVTLVSGLAGILTVILYVAYKHRFGEYEAGLGGLAQSVFAFTPPYPTYVASWKVIAVMLGMFGIVSAAYAGLITPGERARGVALALLLTAGLGLATPALALMTLAGALTWLDAGTREPAGGGAIKPAPGSVDTTLEAVADALALPSPVVLEAEGGMTVAVSGEVEDIVIDLRARPTGHTAGGAWQIELVTGVLGRARPTLEFVSDPSGSGRRPSHALGKTHRQRGSDREAEALDDALLDALAPFEGAHTELWSDGSRVRFGADLSAFDCPRVAALARALVRRD